MNPKNQYLDELVNVIRKVSHDKELLKSLLWAILTPKERIDVPTRWQIIKLLDKNVPQRKIAKKLNVGLATITRGSKELKHYPKGFKAILNYLKDHS